MTIYQQQQSLEFYMQEALLEAEKAQAHGDIPVGAVIVRQGEIIARGHNLREQEQSVLLHAEMVAIAEACQVLGSWRLKDCDLYVTLEPCPMCAGAIIQAQIKTVIFGADDSKWGAGGSLFQLLESPLLNYQAEVISGICAPESKALLQQFFLNRRNSSKSGNDR
ncbi:MAG: nucleoside deaminase [Peptococcaceae bacterium]|nr:nucleoside deaminase [Peptococcaceae bacterium]